MRSLAFRFGWAGILLGAWLALGAAAESRGRIAWNPGAVEVDVEDWSLTEVLESLAGGTGWRVYMEPGTEGRISARFKADKPESALPRLLRRHTYALLPDGNGVRRLYVYRTGRDQATQRIHPADPKSREIGNELVVTLKEGAAIETLARALGARVAGRIDGLNSYRLVFDSEEEAASARSQLAADPRVESVDSNFWVDRPDTLQAPAGISAPPILLKPARGPDGGYTIVALIDTHVQPDLLSGRDLILPSLSVAGPAEQRAGEPSHGTSMADIILRGLQSVAGPGETSFRLLPVDAYGSHASTTTFEVARAISEAIQRGASYINLSLGSEGDSPLLKKIIAHGREQQILFFGAAGNAPTTQATFPAAYPEVIAVTAGSRSGQLAPYANRGEFVDIIAPGTAVVMVGGRPYVITGTSAATAAATGTAAGLAQKTGAPAKEVEAVILRSLQFKAPSPADAKP